MNENTEATAQHEPVWAESMPQHSGKWVFTQIMLEVVERRADWSNPESEALTAAIRALPELAQGGMVSSEALEGEVDQLHKLAITADNAELVRKVEAIEVAGYAGAVIVDLMRQKPFAAYEEIAQEAVKAVSQLQEAAEREAPGGAQ